VDLTWAISPLLISSCFDNFSEIMLTSTKGLSNSPIVNLSLKILLTDWSILDSFISPFWTRLIICSVLDSPPIWSTPAKIAFINLCSGVKFYTPHALSLPAISAIGIGFMIFQSEQTTPSNFRESLKSSVIISLLNPKATSSLVWPTGIP